MLIYFLLMFLVSPWSSQAETRLFLDDPQIMRALESGGASFAEVAFGQSSNIANAKLFGVSESYRFLVGELKSDLEGARREDRTLAVGMKSTHRLFDIGWLNSESGWFELAGVVNRLDRAPFKAGSCGEFRFIYRLAYLKKSPSKIYSRLPMTVNVVFWAGTDCAAAAAVWNEFLKKPTAFASLKRELKSIEVNVQSVRWPSTIRPDMGGYAEYILRVFQPSGAKLVSGTLENTPDFGKLSVESKKKLLAWIKIPANLKAIDEGIAVIPEEFLSRSARSVALHGVHRLANAPFSMMYDDPDFDGVEFKPYRTFKSPHGLFRRLNDLTCMGCHQGRTVAGFHFLGRDRQDTDAVNAIAVSSSAHFIQDQKRRADFFTAVANKKVPENFRPLSVHAEEETGTFGAHCGLGDPSFSKWTCASGFECRRIIADDRVSRTGVCVPVALTAGSPCQPVKMRADRNPHRDRAIMQEETACAPGDFCEGTSVGFPGGMCSGDCSDLRLGETCGSIAVLVGFNSCLSRGKDPFAKCLSDNVRPGALKSCSETEACRDDFICARTLAGGGACIPPYFLFQLRVDGHPKAG